MATTTTSTLSTKTQIRICPTKTDNQQTLIREKITTNKCEKRQFENFHKCHNCIYHQDSCK